MTKEQAIDKVLDIALAEVGYLEKKNGNNLYDKTLNAGQNNYTKYWAEIMPSFQGQAWCACFVTWCFVKAFGKEMATKLLKHFPYVYCPTMANLFTLNANPKRGDIVVFYRNGTFAHTGLVTGVRGDYFNTAEGNTSGGSAIIPNGGAVCSKGYYNSQLPGTKFITVDWSLVTSASDTSPAPAPVHWAKQYLDKLMLHGYVANDEVWGYYDSPVSKAMAVALLDKVTGGIWTSNESDASIHWAQPHVISLCGKTITTDKEQWLTEPDASISAAMLLALVDKATGGTAQAYVNRVTDHWGRNHLDSLCDKGIIDTPDAWTVFDGEVSRGNCMALVCKAFGI